jgi:hypothetical protein
MTDPLDLSDCDPVLAKAIQGLSMQAAMDRVARDPALHGFSRMRTFDPARKPEETATIRKLMNNFGAAKYCDNPLCKRAGTCMTPKVRCFWENLTVVQKLVFPALWRKVEEMEAAGVEFNFPPAARPMSGRR